MNPQLSKEMGNFYNSNILDERNKMMQKKNFDSEIPGTNKNKIDSKIVIDEEEN